MARGLVDYPWINDARVFVRKGETGFTMNIYCGLHDFADMAYLLHVLRPGDLFADVGSNIGSYTILASAVRQARAISFEPVPDTFSRLLRNLELNHLGELVTAHNLGVSDHPGIIRFSANENCCNHVLRDDEKEKGIEVKVGTLDDIFGDSCPDLMKIDVEGFEWPVLNGAAQTLQNPKLHSIIIELNENGSLYGYSETAIIDLLKSHDFASYIYDPFTRKLSPHEPVPGNVLFVRDLKRIEELVRTSETFRIKNVDL